MAAGYYLLTLVLHDQSRDIEGDLASYSSRITLENIPDVPFHAVDLLHGRADYEGLAPETRKRLPIAFSMFVRTLPIRYHTFSYSPSDVRTLGELETRMRRDLVNFIFDHLGDFQTFDHVPVYYDGGHEAVSKALHGAFGYALSREAVVYRNLSYQDKRLAQAADYLCSVELAAMRYEKGEASKTYQRFWGKPRNFKQNYLKQARRKRI